MCSSQHFVDIEPVGLLESFFEKLARNFEADVAHIRGRGKITIREFGDVERELSSDMGVRAFMVRDRRPELIRQVGKLNCGGPIYCLGVPDGIPHIMRQGANSKRILIQRPGIAQKPGDKIATAYVVGQIAEELLPNG